MKTYTIAIIVILIFAVFYIFLLDNSLSFVLTDTHTYILLGKSLSLGQGYRQIWLPGNPEYKKLPPFFPLLLAPIIYFLGYNFFVMKLVCVITAIGSLWLVYLLFKRLKQSMALIILLLCGFSFQFIYYSQQILTEIPYLFFSLLALIFVEKAAIRKNFYSGTLIFSIFFILVSFFTRTIGASLGISMFIYLLLERRRRPAQSRFLKDIILLAFFIFIPIILWMIKGYNFARSDNTYLQEFFSTMNPLTVEKEMFLGERIIRAIYAYVFYAYPKILTAIQFSQRSIVAFMLTAMTAFGFLYCWVKERKTQEYYTVLFIPLLFLWPWSISSGARFLVPIIPFIFYYFIMGLRRILELINVKEKFKTGILIFVIGTLLFLNIREFLRFVTDKTLRYGYSQRKINDYWEMIKWTKDNTSSNSLLASSVDTPIYLYFERKTIGIPCTANAQEAMEIIYKNKVNYILISPIIPWSIEYLQPIINSKLESFTVVYQENYNTVYKVNKEKKDNRDE